MLGVPPSAAFTAIPLNDVDCKIAVEELQEPLLPPPKIRRVVNTAPELWRLKTLSAVTGSLVAVLSQIILSQTLWMDNVLEKSTADVVVFSLMWSFWTCLAIFVAMMVLVRLTVSADGLDRQSYEDRLFQAEAHHIVGALLSISLIWMVVDVVQSMGSTVRLSSMSYLLYLVLAVLWYAVFVRCLWHRSTKAVDEESASPSTMLSTYQMIAATLGLISGLCSQFLLSFCLWTDHMSKPIIDNVVIFSILWSILTVVLTFCGCLSFRLLTSGLEAGEAERVFLRMESHYVFCSLIGICVAWILIDLVFDMPDQILPSLGMLAVSLLAFGVILRCFPEDQCLSDAADVELADEPVKV